MDSDGEAATTKRGRGRPPGKGKSPKAKGASSARKTSKSSKTSKTAKHVTESEQSDELLTDQENGQNIFKSLEISTQPRADINYDDINILEEGNLPISFSVSSTREPLHNNKPLLWKCFKVNLIGEKCQNPRIHFCDECVKPILTYGRMIPCKHVFCYTCAQLNDIQCKKCGDRVVRVEKAALGSVFKCHIESCGRTYLSSRDLQAHIAHRHTRRAPPTPSASGSQLASSSAAHSHHSRVFPSATQNATSSRSRENPLAHSHAASSHQFGTAVPVVQPFTGSHMSWPGMPYMGAPAPWSTLNPIPRPPSQQSYNSKQRPFFQ